MWLPGMLFDWQHYAIAPQRVRALFRSSYIRHAGQEDIELAAADMLAQCEKQEEIQNDVIAEEEQGPIANETASEIRAEDVDIVGAYIIQHVGGPYYNVIGPDGAYCNDKALHKGKAQELADELNNRTATDGFSTEAVRDTE